MPHSGKCPMAVQLRHPTEQLKDPAFRAAYEQTTVEIGQVDDVMVAIDRLRIEAGCSKAELARRIGKNPGAIRRLFSAEVNPELRTITALAAALDAEVRIVPVGSLTHGEATAGR